MVLLYGSILWSYHLGIRVAALFSAKAGKWVEGRQNIFRDLEAAFQNPKQVKAKTVWMHCASLGEFEQGRTVLDQLKKLHPEVKILLTFFSPSGFEMRKNYPSADWVFYLPLDTPSNARRFLNIAKPSVAVFVKYEFWYHYLRFLKKDGTPTLLISAVFRPGQIFFKWYGGIFREMLGSFSKIFVQDQASQDLLKGFKNLDVAVLGDTRVDRVLDIANQERPFPAIQQFCAGCPVFICGSTWPSDEKIILPFIHAHAPSDWKFIIAPHEISPRSLQRMEARTKLACIRYSALGSAEAGALKRIRVLIIDNIGILSSIYRFGKIAYIGGGFGKGIHNILEPAAFGLPVIFGSNYRKSIEAKAMIANGGAFTIQNTQGLVEVFSALKDPAFHKKSAERSRSFVLSNSGPTKTVVDEIIRRLD